MKKLWAVLLTLALLTALLPLTATAAESMDEFRIEIPEVNTFPGYNDDIVTVTILYKGSIKLLDGILIMTYDPQALELQIPESENSLCSLSNGMVNVEQAGYIKIGFMHPDGLSKTGTVGEFPFKILDPQVGATLTVSIYAEKLMCKDGTPMGRSLITETENYQSEGTIRILEQPQVDTSELESAVEETLAVDLSMCTEATATAFNVALAAAQAVLKNPFSTQEEIDTALAALAAAIEAVEEEAAVLKGDADGDGEITSTDARLTLQLAVNKAREEDVPGAAVLDVDGDGGITSTDARLILQYAVKKIPDWP